MSWFRLSLTVFTLSLLALSTWAGPKGVIICRPLGNISITIDGDFTDWPLGAYEQVSEQPLFPDGQDMDSTNAMGDYVVYDPDRVGFFNTKRGDVSEDNPHTDFEVNTYFAYDAEYLYVLSIFIDDEIRDDRDDSLSGMSPFLNDGIEFFFDALNDSDDCATDINFPNFDPEAPNIDDFQIATGINLFFDSIIPFEDGGLGTVQGIERSGNVELFGTEKFVDGLYQDKLAETPGPDIAALAYENLRAAGAPNAVIADNPTLNFSGYAQEIRIPFGVIEGFTPDHAMGFDLFWRDVDFSSDAIQFIDWAQSTSVPCDNIFDSLFQTSNWGEMRFEGAPLDGSGSSVNDWSLK